MRQERTVQASLFDLFADHEIGRELKAMSQLPIPRKPPGCNGIMPPWIPE
jgi:hypothetical protein